MKPVPERIVSPFDTADAARWRFIRTKIRPHWMLEGEKSWYIDGQVIGLGETLEEAIDASIRHAKTRRDRK